MPTPAHPGHGAWVDSWLGAPRFGTYRAACGGDDSRALALYEWNAALSGELFHDLAHVEVGLRNAYDRALSARTSSGPHWTADGALFAPLWRRQRVWDPAQQRRVKVSVDINAKPRKALDRARRDAGGTKATQGKIIAQLTFGFWRYLSSTAHEVTLWRPYLHRAFPSGTARGDVDDLVASLHEIRNRIAHREPIIAVDVAAAYCDLLRLAQLLEPALAAHIRSTSGVPARVAGRPT